MQVLGVADVLGFEFLDPPSPDALADGLKQLYMLGALDEDGTSLLLLLLLLLRLRCGSPQLLLFRVFLVIKLSCHLLACCAVHPLLCVCYRRGDTTRV